MLATALTAIFVNRVAVVAIEAAFGSEPEITLRILQDAHDGALREPVAHRQMLEVHRPGFRHADGWRGVRNRGTGVERA